MPILICAPADAPIRPAGAINAHCADCTQPIMLSVEGQRAENTTRVCGPCAVRRIATDPAAETGILPGTEALAAAFPAAMRDPMTMARLAAAIPTRGRRR